MKINKFDLVISTVIIILSTVFFLIFAESITYRTEYIGADYYPSKVITISKVESQGNVLSDDVSLGETLVIEFVARISSGEFEGDTVTALQYHDSYLYDSIRQVEVGDNVLLTKTATGDVMADTWVMANYNRINLIIGLIAIFLLLVIFIGRGKGVSAIISLALTLAAIFVVYIPTILAGYNIYLITGGVTIYIVIMSLMLLNGSNSKTYCAIAGNILGVVIAAGLSFAANKIFMITGVVSQEHIYLAYFGKDIGFSLHEIIWSGIVIGALGAIMDVSMSLSSSMKELSDTMENPTRLKLIKSGLNIGHDIIGTMMNTLVLAYVGSSLVMILLITVYNDDLLTIINSELVLVEILQAVIGSIGILLTVPFTVLVCSSIFYGKKNRKEPIKDDYLFDIIPLNKPNESDEETI